MPMTYSDLVATKANTGSIAFLINYALVPSDQILEDAQALIYSLLRHDRMKAAANLSLALGANSVALPSDFLDPIQLLDEWGAGITHTDERSLFRFRPLGTDGLAPQGPPSLWAQLGLTAQFDTRSEKARTLNLIYFQKPAALGPSNQSNWLTERYPHIVRAACKHFAFQHRREDTAADMEFKKLAALIDRANVESDLTLRGAAFPTMELP